MEQDPAAHAATPGAARWIAASCGSTRGCAGGISSSGSSRLGEQWVLRALDAHIRRRLRAIILHHWKRKRTIARNLIALGVKRHSAWRQIYAGRKSLVGAQPHARSRSRPAHPRSSPSAGCSALVELHRANTSPSSPPSRRNWRYGDRSRSINGRRRGSQPAVPKSRVRTAQARFCGSRGGQPPRLPDRTCAGADRGGGQAARRAASSTSMAGSGGSVRTSAIDSAER